MTITRICVLFILAFLIMAPADAATSPYDEDPDALFAPVYNRLKIALPANIARDSTVWLRLDELRREPCDRVSIVGLAKALDTWGFRREAANALYEFVLACGGPDTALTMSADFYLKLSDFEKAVEVADALVRTDPSSANAMYLRARALDGAGDHTRALADYATTIELFANKKNLSSNVFVNMSKAYAALGRFCEAISPIETWIALDPVNRDTSQAERLIADYSEKGNCGRSEAKRSQRFPLKGGTNVAVVKVEINGAAGFFILDTGASFVSVQQDFAKRAHLQIDPGSKMTLHTANGDTSGMLSKADSVKLGALTAKNVPIIVQSSSEKLYGKAIDGLLGLSFLSRFEVQIAGGFVEVRTRAPK
jgi:clan AA aspartic protease (TIGR02281 family)